MMKSTLLRCHPELDSGSDSGSKGFLLVGRNGTRIPIVFGLVLLLIMAGLSCGSEGGDSFDPSVALQVNPVVTRVNPAAATAGDAVTIFGYGFSMVPQNNIVIINGVEALATAYNVVTPPVAGEYESITFTVPAGIAAGTYGVLVFVIDSVSNTDITITIN